MSFLQRNPHYKINKERKKGLHIIDLENLSDEPRFLKHVSKWEVSDVQWNPHQHRQNWIASTVI